MIGDCVQATQNVPVTNNVEKHLTLSKTRKRDNIYTKCQNVGNIRLGHQGRI